MHDMQRKLQQHLLWRRPAVALAVLLSLALVVPGQVGVAADTPHSGLQTPMRNIFQALTTVFPLSLNEQQFQDAAQRQRILEALRALAYHAGQLATHGQDVPPHLDFLRRSLASDAQ